MITLHIWVRKHAPIKCYPFDIGIYKTDPKKIASGVSAAWGNFLILRKCQAKIIIIQWVNNYINNAID